MATQDAAEGTLQFDLITPDKKFFSGAATMVVVPGTEGDFGVLAGHAPFISTIRPGVITIDADGAQRKVAVAGGFAEVVPSRCTVLSENAIDLSGLTAADAQKQVADAKEDLSLANTDEQRKKAELRLALSEAIVAAI